MYIVSALKENLNNIHSLKIQRENMVIIWEVTSRKWEPSKYLPDVFTFLVFYNYCL